MDLGPLPDRHARTELEGPRKVAGRDHAPQRAKRRLVQRLSRRPTDAEVAEETERLVQRDARDSTQTVQARDAILIDTTYLTQADQVERIVALARGIGKRKEAQG